MKDANGIEMATGMIVEIENAYFANDNGLWFIDNAPGDPNWSGSEYSLYKLCRNGKPSTARHKVAFWPLCSFCSDPSKNYAAREHNSEYAKITVRTDIATEFIAEYFSSKAAEAQASLDWDRRMGHSAKVLEREKKIVDHYADVAGKLAAAA